MPTPIMLTAATCIVYCLYGLNSADFVMHQWRVGPHLTLPLLIEVEMLYTSLGCSADVRLYSMM